MNKQLIEQLSADLQQTIRALMEALRTLMPDDELKSLPITVAPDGSETRDILGFLRRKITEWDCGDDPLCEPDTPTRFCTAIVLAARMIGLNDRLHHALTAPPPVAKGPTLFVP